MTQSEIEKLIAAERGVLEDALAVALEDRDVANRKVKRIRAELDAAPRLHVRRTRRPSEALPGQGELPAQQERDLRRLPGAAELFPHGIERKAPVADIELTSAGKINVRRAEEQGNAE